MYVRTYVVWLARPYFLAKLITKFGLAGQTSGCMHVTGLCQCGCLRLLELGPVSAYCSGPALLLSFLPQSDFEENVVMLLYRERPELTVAK